MVDNHVRRDLALIQRAVTHPSVLRALYGTPETGRTVWSDSAGTFPGRTSTSRNRRGNETWNEPGKRNNLSTRTKG